MVVTVALSALMLLSPQAGAQVLWQLLTAVLAMSPGRFLGVAVSVAVGRVLPGSC
jgi:hypothetical protein